MVPHGCTIQSRFDRDTESFLRQLSLQIQTNVSQFVAQENSDVGGVGLVGERKPFHISIIEISPLLNVPYVLNTVRDVASRSKRISGHVLPECQVCDNGEVRIKVNCPDIVSLGTELNSVLPGSNGWYSQSNDSLFITIGVFHGIYRYDFGTWLNKELQTNNDLFPAFTSDMLNFSDEWLYVAHAHEQMVPLTGGVNVDTNASASESTSTSTSAASASDSASASALHVMPGNDIDGLLDSFGLSTKSKSSTDTGTGVGMPLPSSNANANANAVLNNDPRGKGKKKEKYGERDKRERPFKGDRRENGKIGVEVEEKIFIPAPIVPKGPYKATMGPSGGSVWGSFSGNGGKVAAPTAILAMREITSKKYIDSASTSSKPTNSSSTSSRRDREPKSSTSTSTSTSTFKGNTVKSPRGTGAGDRINEVHSSNWVCPNCSLVVYGRRNACFKCKTAKPTGEGGLVVPAASGSNLPNPTSPRGQGVSGTNHLYPRKPKDGDVRDGDWICASCKGHNFASKIACFTCRSPRPPGYVIDTPEGNEDGDGPKAERKPGDWTCPNCNENVFAKRNRCYKCSTSKPREHIMEVSGADTDAGEPVESDAQD